MKVDLISAATQYQIYQIKNSCRQCLKLCEFERIFQTLCKRIKNKNKIEFENRILWRIFGPKTDENGEWRRLHNEELHSLYHPPNIARVIKSRRLRWAGHVARMETGTSAFKILTGKPTGKRPLGRPRRRLENNIRMDYKEVDVNKDYYRVLVNAELNLRIP